MLTNSELYCYNVGYFVFLKSKINQEGKMDQNTLVCAGTLNGNGRVILLDDEPLKTIEDLWNYVVVREAGFLPLKIINSYNPTEDLAKTIFDFAKADYWFINPYLENCRCNFPKYVECYDDSETFIEYCKKDLNILLDLMIEICLRLPATLLLGIKLSENFINKKASRIFFEFLRKVNKVKLDLKIYVAT